MSQERLNRLGILVIKNEMLEEIKYKNLISQLHIKNKKRFLMKYIII